MVRRMIQEQTRTNPGSHAKEIRMGITVGYDPVAYDGAGDEDPSHYPESPANTFWVKLAKPSFPQEAGQQELEVEPYDPAVYRLAHHPDDLFVPEGTEVWIALLHGQYFILPEGGEGGSPSFGFLLTTDMEDQEATGNLYAMEDVGNVTILEGATIKARTFFGDLPAGTIGQCELHNGVYVVTNASCPPEEELEEST
jgi:hypothetical protein